MTPYVLKQLHRTLFFFWVCIGIPLSLWLRNSVTWVVVISVYAIIVEHLLGWRGEKKHEEEEANG